MAAYLRRAVGTVHDTAQMIVIHLGRLTGVVGTAVARAGSEVNEMVLDCRDVARAVLHPERDSLDLPLDAGSISIRPRDSSAAR